MPYSRSRTSSRFRRRPTSTRRSRYGTTSRRSTRAYPPRFANSKRKYVKARRFTRAASGSTETKILPINPQNEVAAVAIQSGGKAHYLGFVIQSIPTNWDPSMLSLGGILTQQGSSGVNRIGNYVYFKKTHLTMEIAMKFTSSQKPPIDFRVIVCKAKRANQPAGQTDVPQSSLFLDSGGYPFGYTNPQVNGSDLMLQPLNRREWFVKSDSRFILSNAIRPDSDGGNVGSSPHYPMRKLMMIDLPYYKKARIRGDSNVPDDLDTHWCVFVFASCVARSFAANEWEVNIRGSTTFTDS